MASIRELRPADDGFSYWGNSVKDAIREQTIKKSSDVLLQTTSAGTSISIHPKWKYNPVFMNYCGEFDASASYNVNDVVRVLPGKEYKLPLTEVAGHLATFWDGTGGGFTGRYTSPGSANESTFVTFRGEKPMVGTYICVSPVPAFTTIAELSVNNIISVNSWITSGWDVNSMGPIKPFVTFLRLSDINYYPIWPELPNIASVSPSVLTTARGRYWELISLLPMSQSVCKNGAQTTVWVDADEAPSGSYQYPLTF